MTSPRIPRSLTSRLVPAPRQNPAFVPPRDRDRIAQFGFDLDRDQQLGRPADLKRGKLGERRAGPKPRAKARPQSSFKPAHGRLLRSPSRQAAPVRLADLIDVACAQRRDYIAAIDPRRPCAGSVRRPGSEHPDGHAPARPRRAGARNRSRSALRPPHKLRPDKARPPRRRRPENRQKGPAARIAMRLKDRYQAPFKSRARRRQRRPYFRRMVRVVVEHDPSRGFALDLKAPRDAREGCQRPRRDLKRNTHFQRDRDCRKRVQCHVPPRRRDLTRPSTRPRESR